AESDRKERAKEEKQEAKEKADDARFLSALDLLDGTRAGALTKMVGVKAKLQGVRLDRTVSRLLAEEIVEEIEIRVVGGNGAKVPAKGIRRVTRETPGTL